MTWATMRCSRVTRACRTGGFLARSVLVSVVCRRCRRADIPSEAGRQEGAVICQAALLDRLEPFT
jgi:hypothetical protein